MAVAANIVLGAGTLTDNATVTGRVNPQSGGTVTFQLFGPNNATCTPGAPVFTSTVSYPAGGGPVTSAAFTPMQAGTYRWIASYSGDVNNLSVAGACNDDNETTVIARAGPPSILTTASANIVLGAGNLTDNATVTGRVLPQSGATVTFQLFGPNNAACTPPAIFTSPTIAYPAGGGPVTSAAFTPLLAGTYRWVASYSGDANNLPATGACNDANESTVVNTVTPTIATTASGGIALGGALTDNATVTGRVLPLAGATIDFRLYGPADTTCTATPVFTSLNVPYPVAGGAVTSASFTPTTVGTYRWVASYSGDANNAPVAGACNATNENAVVILASPTIATTASVDISIGGTLTDNAIVSGRVNPVAGATIDFRLYGPNDATCSGTPVFSSLNVPYPVAGGAATSAPFTPTAAGTYRWRATYSGDANNQSVAGLCNDANESVAVAAVQAVTVTTTTTTTTTAPAITTTTTTTTAAPAVLGATLPRTGSNSAGLFYLGAGLILAGLVFVGSTLRRGGLHSTR